MMNNYLIRIRVIKFNINNETYLSIHDNVNTIYLFKNHKLFSTEITDYRMYVNPYTLYNIKSVNSVDLFNLIISNSCFNLSWFILANSSL